MIDFNSERHRVSLDLSRPAFQPRLIGRGLMKHLLAISLAMISLWATGCNTTSSPPPPPTLASIAVTPAISSVALSTPQQFKATGTFSDSSTQDLTATATWSSSATTVATISAAGLASTVGVGPTTIKATSGSVSGSTTFTVTPGFIATGNLVTGRFGPTATLLTNGTVLLAGGRDSTSSDLTSAELYNSATGTFTATGSLSTSRSFHTATLLNNGLVLLAGGESNTGNDADKPGALYNPATGTFAVTGSLNSSHVFHTATLLNNGKVLVVGGLSTASVTVSSSAELYDPAAGTFSTTGSTSTPRWLHTATLLRNGIVLVAGGFDSAGNQVGSAELYNPSTATFTTTGSLNTARGGHTATLLNDGRVLVAGGGSGSLQANSGSALSSAELYDPATGKFTATGTMNSARGAHTATLLDNGTVLLARGGGGANGTAVTVLASAELYNPPTGTFASTGGMKTGSLLDTATLLNNGEVLVAGGEDGTLSAASSSPELYEPGLPTLQSIAITPANPSIAVGTSQHFLATGTFSDGSTSPLASVIWSSSNPGVAPVSNDATNKGTAVAVAAGSTSITATVGSVTNATTLTVH
jgi:hypothetical protein